MRFFTDFSSNVARNNEPQHFVSYLVPRSAALQEIFYVFTLVQGLSLPENFGGDELCVTCTLMRISHKYNIIVRWRHHVHSIVVHPYVLCWCLTMITRYFLLYKIHKTLVLALVEFFVKVNKTKNLQKTLHVLFWGYFEKKLFFLTEDGFRIIRNASE